MLNITDKVRFGLSKLVDAPCMMGYFKPVILLPFTLSTYLSAEEIEIIILHELAHIKRNDYLVNLAQQAMSVLLFFNPFAQLINRVINQERENSCDDIVIEATQKPLVYAHALLKLEQTRQQEWQLALAATGKKYHLLNRIERIMKTKKPIGNTRHILLAIALLTASITGLAWLNPTIAHGKISFNKIKPIVVSELFTDTVKKKKPVYHHKLAATKKPAKTRYVETFSENDDDFNDAQLQKFSAEMSKYGEAISKYYQSDDFKKLEQDMELKGKEMNDFYDRPELKELERKQSELGDEFNAKWGNTEETNKLSARMGELGSQIGLYYSSPEFKSMNEKLENKYGIPHNRHTDWDEENNDNYKKYHAELKQNIAPEERDREIEMKKLGAQMHERYNSPEFHAKQAEMRAMSDSMRKAFRSPAMEQVKQQMRQLSAQMRAYQHNPQIEKQRELLRETSAKMRAYMNTPAFKQRMQKWKRFNYNYNSNFNNNYRFDWDEKPEAPEKPEKPEAPEKPEKPDTTNNQ
jgi:hypothetical protein